MLLSPAPQSRGPKLARGWPQGPSASVPSCLGTSARRTCFAPEHRRPDLTAVLCARPCLSASAAGTPPCRGQRSWTSVSGHRLSGTQVPVGGSKVQDGGKATAETPTQDGIVSHSGSRVGTGGSGPELERSTAQERGPGTLRASLLPPPCLSEAHWESPPSAGGLWLGEAGRGDQSALCRS